MRLKLNQKRATILLCSVAVAVFATAAVARPVHHNHRHRAATTTLTAVKAANDVADRDMRYPVYAAQTGDKTARGHFGRRSRTDARAPAQAYANAADSGFSSSDLVAEARKYIGTNPTGRGSLWCGAFMDLVLKRTGHPGGGNLALGYEHYGTRVSGPQVGAIAVMGRRGGGHVGVVSGVDANGNPIIVSGNHNHTVAEAVYPRGRIAAYVVPGG